MFKRAMEALNKLAKSESTEGDLDGLVKALEQELAGNMEISIMKKSDGKTQAEQDAEAEAEALRKAQEAEAAAETEALRKAKEVSEAEEAERLRKSQEHQRTEEELLVEASEAYRELQKSVAEGQETTLGEIGALKTSLAALLNLNIKMAGVVGDLVKSQQENMDEMKKSIGSLGAAPTVPNAARLGTGTGEREEGELKKSRSEIQEALQTAVQAGKVASYWLSDFGTHKNVDRLPEEVRAIIEV